MSKLSRSPQRRAARVCRKKKVYKTLQEAGIAQGAFLVRNRTALKPYQCEVCGLWHLTTEASA
jgi:hypothetical protein